MNKAIAAIVASLAVVSAAAQSPEEISGAIWKKLNFEAPLFGVTMKNVKPTWSLVAFGEMNLGYSHALNIPETTHISQGTLATGETVEYTDYKVRLHSGGTCGDLSLLELRLRPWRNGNLFFWGLNLGFERRSLPAGYLFDKNNEPVLLYFFTGYSLASYSERMLSLEIGYLREVGDWSFGLQLLPGIGYSQYRNSYNALGGYQKSEDLDLHVGGRFTHRRDDAIGQPGLRFGARADVWYRALGAFVSVRPGHTGFNGGGPQYTTVSAGLSIRY